SGANNARGQTAANQAEAAGQRGREGAPPTRMTDFFGGRSMRVYLWRPMLPLGAAPGQERYPNPGAAPGRGSTDPNGIQLLRLWRARHRHRRELAMLLAADFRDVRLPIDLVAHEIRKWPWQPFHPQWRDLDEALLQGLATRRREAIRRTDL